MEIKKTSAAEAISLIRSGNRVFIHSVAAAPQVLVKELVNQSSRLRNVNIYHIHTEGNADYTRPELRESFQLHTFFTGKNVREAVNTGIADYIPAFLSEIPQLFRKKVIPLDVAMIQVSPPDEHGFCSLGVSVDITRAAIENCNVIIAEININMPRTHGNSFIHISKINAAVETDYKLPELSTEEPSEVCLKVGKNIASIIEDGATLQMGIGKIPDATLRYLRNHKDLGIHTEMFSDGIIPLIESGVITNSRKKKHPGKIIAGFVFGTEKLYRFINNNPMVELHDIAYVNDTFIIAQNPKATAVNSAIEIDLTGQICSDSIGTRMYSGVGGQMDFIRGASLSEGGKPVIALPSVTSRGISRIVPVLREGAGVVTTRAHAHYVVTEHGIADLYGKSVRERISLLIRIAHPHHQEDLSRKAFEIFRYLI